MSPDFTAEALYFGCGERQWFLVLLSIGIIGPISLHDINNLLGYHGYITDVPPFVPILPGRAEAGVQTLRSSTVCRGEGLHNSSPGPPELAHFYRMRTSRTTYVLG